MPKTGVLGLTSSSCPTCPIWEHSYVTLVSILGTSTSANPSQAAVSPSLTPLVISVVQRGR